MNADLAEGQRLERVGGAADRPHHHHRPLAWADPRPCHAGRIAPADLRDPLGDGAVVVARQSVEDGGGEGRGDRIVGLQRRRQPADEGLLRCRQLGIGRPFGGESLQLLLVLAHRLRRVIREDSAGGEERPVRPAQLDVAEYAVAVSVLLAQVHVEPAGEEPAQHLVGHEERQPVRMPRREQPPRHPDLRLRGPGLVHRVDEAAVLGRQWRQLQLGQPRRLPPAEVLLEELRDLRGDDVAGHRDDRIVRAVPPRPELEQIGDGDRFHGLGRSSRRLSPRMLVAVEELRRLVRGQRTRVPLLLREAGELQPADALHVVLAERGVLQHVGEQLDGLGQRLLERVQPHAAGLVAGARR